MRIGQSAKFDLLDRLLIHKQNKTKQNKTKQKKNKKKNKTHRIRMSVNIYQNRSYIIKREK